MGDQTAGRVPIQASPGRRLLQGLLALGLWVVFLYWWWLVFQRVSRAEVRFTAIFIAVTFGISVSVTCLWFLYNRGRYRLQGDRREGNPPVVEDYSHDKVGRSVWLGEGVAHLRESPSIQVEVQEHRKFYRVPPAAGKRPASSPRANEVVGA